MDRETYAERLAWFKQNERPEAVLLVADNLELIRIVVAWTHVKAGPVEEMTPLADRSENGVWEWLWENTHYSPADLIGKTGARMSETGLAFKLRPLIGNRVLYPDGTVNSFVQRYLRDHVVRLFSTSSKLTRAKKDRE